MGELLSIFKGNGKLKIVYLTYFLLGSKFFIAT